MSHDPPVTSPSSGSASTGARWWERCTLSPRAALVLAAVVVVVALVVVAVGTLRGRSSGEVTVTGGSQPAPTVPSPSGGGPVPSGPAAVGSVAPSASAAVAAVYVLGAVRHAGVVEVPVGTRVDAELERAGGAAEDADLARLNLARAVVDGERLYVPRVGETSVPEALGPDVTGGSGTAGGASVGGAGGGVGSGAGGTAGGPDAVVDLNTADQATLETLPGIGPALAGRIIAWREEHGGFSSVDDLLDVSGIGQARLDDLRDRVRV
ncbi:ComEA family DNA-binding protein [Curtobacterium sp. RHCKG23]|uniref:ComEA family DNA-binding protein n=1 Tax=Curtobacterium citri TaxID=3055139 RepID=A0ABT7T636_9MICO|nr:ComEA family DNA-binding protein [Curtobacterium citri]MDM7885040.1 ComEA family DNA-binding protein [Curtobacterium citri]